MGWLLFMRRILLIMIKRPEILICLTALFSLAIQLWEGANGAVKTRKAAQPKMFFNSSHHVTNIFYGALSKRDVILNLSEISFVLYYAPWDLESSTAARHFSDIALHFHQQVSFVAINCWWDGGDCKGNFKVESFPQIRLHHKILKFPIHYKGPHLRKYYRKFLEKVLNPTTYLGDSQSVDDFIKGHQVSILTSFAGAFSKKVFVQYNRLALKMLETNFQFPTDFGFVLSQELSSRFELRRHELKLFDRSQSDFYASKQFKFSMNSSLDDVIQWISFNKQVLHRLILTGEKCNKIHKILKDGPSLISTFEELDTGLMEEIAIRYNRQCVLNQQSCVTPVHATHCSVCYISSLALSGYNESSSFKMKNILVQKLFNKLDWGRWSNIELRPLYDPNRSRLSVSCDPTNHDAAWHSSNHLLHHKRLNCLKHQTNRTLNFVVIDFDTGSDLAESLGLKSAHQVALVQNEEIIVLPSANLEQSILNYTDGILRGNTRETSKIEQFDDGLQIQQIIPQQFDELVLQSQNDALVYYHADWCGACSIYSHTLLNFKQAMCDVQSLTFYDITDDVNSDLPAAFSSPFYPTLVLYPGNRTVNSVVFSRSTQMNFSNLIGFLLRHASPSTKARILLSVCQEKGDGGILLSYDVCKIKGVEQRLAELY
ncbi:thioredoxin domain-containing protein 11-like isoform X1 [Clavelina lepadiformis]|uniref:thioredoxin domain-containing protein 11-like isoform X1 n=1 Tax=Clavelina lepadiformis TaxID=159417 RepID=UPI0040423ACC